jgi:serine/threonine protein kinase
MSSRDDYFIGPKEIQELRGRSFEVKSRALGTEVKFQVSNDDVGEPLGPLRGAEAVGLCAECLHPDGTVPSFLKIFTAAVPERVQRNRFLMDLGLSGRHWMFSAMPYGVLPQVSINDVKIVGHLSRRLVDRSGRIAPTLGSFVLEDQWQPSTDERFRFAGQLACAVHALESLDLVHGDISLNNVLVGWDEQDGEVAVLCDFDGFRHPSQPALPIQAGRMSVRKVGSPGFQSPLLLERMTAGETDMEVVTDRFALAALLCQIMVWQPGYGEDLGRAELLSTDMIEQRSLSGLPGHFSASWPEGFKLLRQALEAKEPAHMPSARQWLEVVGGPPVAPPRLALRNPRRNGGKEIQVQLGSAEGNFQRVVEELKEVRFRQINSSVEVEFLWSDSVELRPLGGARETAASRLSLRPGDEVFSGFWAIRRIS